MTTRTNDTISDVLAPSPKKSPCIINLIYLIAQLAEWKSREAWSFRGHLNFYVVNLSDDLRLQMNHNVINALTQLRG